MSNNADKVAKQMETAAARAEELGYATTGVPTVHLREWADEVRYLGTLDRRDELAQVMEERSMLRAVVVTLMFALIGVAIAL